MGFAVLHTMRGYRRADLSADLVAGLTTAVMLVPQGMAYAMLAGLPPIVGLYASVVPLALYALLGTSRELAVGPVAMVSLLVASGVGAVAPVGSPEFIAYAVGLAAMVGVLQLAMGVLRAGFLVNFLSHPVISGFTSAAALIIGLSQVGHLLGVDVPRSHRIYEVVANVAAAAGDANMATVLIGAMSIGVLSGFKRWWPAFPRALAVVVFGSLAVWSFGLAADVAIVGDVPAGFPRPRWVVLDIAAARALLPVAITIALVGFMESISVAKAFARRGKYEVDPNQELIGLGAANIGGALFGGYPVTGGFSRTAVNAQAGARSTLASLVTAAAIAITLLFFTPLFYYLPKAVLAGIIMTAVFGLVDIAEVSHLWRVKRSDLVLLTITFAATVSVGIEPGILVGVGASLLWFVVRSTRPHTAVLGRLPGTGIFRNRARYPEVQTEPGVLVLRMDSTFYFGNVTFLKDTLRRLEGEGHEPLRAVILDASAINGLDSSADAALHELLDDYQARGLRLILARVKGPVMDVLHRSGFAAQLGSTGFAESVADAIAILVADGPAQPGPAGAH